MGHKISYATAGFKDRDIEAALDAIAAAGFDSVELLSKEPHIPTPLTGEALTGFTRRLYERGLSAPTVHAPLGRSVLGAPDEAWRREEVERLASYLRFTAGVGANNMVIHPIPNPIFVPDADHPETPARIGDAVRRSLDDLMPVAQEAGVRMLLENLPYHCDYPYITMKALRPLADQYPAEQVGLVVDTGHTWVVGDLPQDEIRVAGDRLWGVHLQDVAHESPEDSHWVPTHGDLDWDAVRAALVDVEYAGDWTFEVLYPRHGETSEELAAATYQVARQWGL